MSLSQVRRSRKESVLSRRQIEGLIADGRKIIVVDGKVLKVDAWLRFHPGGDKAIMHMVGRDATDEVDALHSAGARQRMDLYQIGRIEGRWVNFLPPIQGGEYRPLMENVEDEGSESDTEQESSSLESSKEPSPVFEPVEHRASYFRLRKSRDAPRFRDSSTSSISSVDLDDQYTKPKLSHLDARTQQELDLDLAKYPALDPATQHDVVRQYQQLNERIRTEGLYQCRYSSYAIEMCRYAFLFAMFYYALKSGWYATSGLFLGLFWHQLVFTAHDAGHMGITHDFTTDTIIGIIIADFLGGLSLGWWKRSHNVHHIVTNSAEHDPDIQHMPFFAISHRFFDSLRSTYHDKIMTFDPFAKFMIRYQHYLYYPILTFGRFNLYVQSWLYLFLGLGPRKGPAWWTRWLEIDGIPTPWARFVFVMVSHATTMPLHVQITLSHFAMSTADVGVAESFPQRMLRTTMDVDCPAWLDFVHGGLQFQAVHHLYPRIPRHNLRRTQKLVQQFCEDIGIPYALYGFVDGNRQVVGKLADVGRQAAILAQCQKTLAQSADLGMH
ncbi:hypothetical protein LTR04_005288 [Oleoguttula sp. CCFEE 6159]|nr:hypothetical protein LTR04_005288 [Oleoguttula sp. CCFEE 6159]